MMALYMGIVLLVIFLTRILAYWTMHALGTSEIIVIPEILKFTYVQNFGAGFGIFEGEKVLLISVSVLLFILITYYVVSKKKSIKLSTLIPLALIAGGGISNVADRLQFGYVVDYINVYCIDYPVFNLADICVVVGVFWIAGKILFSKETDEEKEIKEAEDTKEQ